MAIVAVARVPPGIVALGVLLGGLSSLTALGLVLVWRAHRFLNVAHASVGLVAAALVAQLVSVAGMSYWWALPMGLAAGAALGLVTERVLASRLATAPRLVVTVASLGLAHVFGALALGTRFAGRGSPFVEVPLRASIDLFPVRFGGAHLLALAATPVALAAMAGFLRGTRYGMTARAFAQNDERARSLGLPVRAATVAVWLAAGTLAALGGILSAPILGPALESGPGASVLLAALAPAVVAGMRSLTATVLASLAVGVAYQSALWVSPRPAWADGALLLVILAGLLARSRADRRVEDAAGASSWGSYVAVRPLPRLVAADAAVRAARAGGFALALAAACGASLLLPPSAAQRLGALTVFAIAAVSVAVVASLGGQLSLGHWGVVGAGCGIAALVLPRAGLAPAAASAVVGGAAASVLVGLAALRGGALGYAASTLALGVAVQSAFASWPALRPLEPARADDPRAVAGACVLLLGVSLVVARGVRARRIGREMIAVRDNEAVAQTHGVSPVRARVAAYALSGAVAGAAGCAYLLVVRVVQPESFAADRSLLLVAMVIVGGLGSVWGAVLGAALVEGASLFLGGGWRMLGTGAGVLAVLLLLPGGLASPLRAARDAALTSMVTRRRAAPVHLAAEARP